jgi:hypothetical protein
MNKKEKYFNYVIGELIKNTEIDYEQEEIRLIKLDNIKSDSIFPTDSQSDIASFRLLFNQSFQPPAIFHKHVKWMYGVHDEEIEFIWDQYRVKLIKQINYLIE